MIKRAEVSDNNLPVLDLSNKSVVESFASFKAYSSAARSTILYFFARKK